MFVAPQHFERIVGARLGLSGIALAVLQCRERSGFAESTWRTIVLLFDRADDELWYRWLNYLQFDRAVAW